MKKLICSAGTKEDLEKMINQYYYSSNYQIMEDNSVYNKKTDKTLDNVKVVQKCGRWRFEIK